MSGDHAKRKIMTGEKATSSGRTLSRESDNKHKEESSSSIKSHRRGDKKKIKKVVYYETDSSSPSTSSSESSSTSKRHGARSIVRYPYTILVFQSALHYFPYPYANHHISMVKIIVCGVIK
jgi:hypothetical protein